jgi:hypothetical protein
MQGDGGRNWWDGAVAARDLIEGALPRPARPTPQQPKRETRTGGNSWDDGRIRRCGIAHSCGDAGASPARRPLTEIAGKLIELFNRALPEAASKAIAVTTTQALNSALRIQ